MRGLAKIVDSPAMRPITKKPQRKGTFTRLGKVVGTVSYMAPERATGESATIKTDIYALGVILYQMLTLHSPFRRGTLKEFRKTMHREEFVEPTEIAPYRDVSKMLSQICKKCLSPQPEDRYVSVEELIRDLENYIEGRSEWFRITKLDINNKDVWEFQENVLIAEHIAITRSTEISDWVSLMISKASFTESILLEARVRIRKEGHGIGFLMSIPESVERRHLNDGYCLWIGTDNHPATKLLRSTVEVVSYPEICLKRDEWYSIRIEKVENNIHLYLNNTLQLTYIGHAPVVGKHVGLLSRDADFDIEDFYISIGGHMATVSCLAVPDAFLAHKDYDRALNEYRRIGYAFPGRAEGRDALFRAGITLLEKAKESGKDEDYDAALNEFDNLHNTPGAPLEYLGKALVYQKQEDYEEEIKCYTLAFRRYPKHPLLAVLSEQVAARMHETSRYDRIATYSLIYLAVRHIPEIADSLPSHKLFESLKNHWEPLPFIILDPKEIFKKTCQNRLFSIQLAFWISKPFYLIEMIDELLKEKEKDPVLIKNALFSLFVLGSWEAAKKRMDQIDRSDPMHCVIQCHESGVQKALETFFASPKDYKSIDVQRTLIYLFEYSLFNESSEFIHTYCKRLDPSSTPNDLKLAIDCIQIWSYLKNNDKENAGTLLHSYPLEMITNETSMLYFLYGCWLLVYESKEIATVHFSGALDVPFPRTWSLTANYFNGQIGHNNRWLKNSFLWEHRKLYQQLELYYHCAGNLKESEKYKILAKKEFINVTD